jgi:hypothetical protein
MALAMPLAPADLMTAGVHFFSSPQPQYIVVVFSSDLTVVFPASPSKSRIILAFSFVRKTIRVEWLGLLEREMFMSVVLK